MDQRFGSIRRGDNDRNEIYLERAHAKSRLLMRRKQKAPSLDPFSPRLAPACVKRVGGRRIQFLTISSARVARGVR
jgi:hypothetical protein